MRQVGKALLRPAALAAAGLAAAAAAAGVADVPSADAPAVRHVGRIVEPALPVQVSQLRARALASWHGGPVTASTGEVVRVLVSDRYTAEQHTPEGWAEFIVATPHGSEVTALTAYVAPLDEVAQLCGGDALGCYGGGQLVVLGDVFSGVTPQEVMRHELGHHVAANRQNPPWSAVDWGPKAWATDQGVCPRTAAGQLHPGNEDAYYGLNPGEGWAEAYRVFAEQRAGVVSAPIQIVDAGFQPDAEALAAIERDVLAPWTAPTTTVFRKQMTAKSPKVWSIPLRPALDGSLEITVALPKGGYHRVALLGPDGRTVRNTGLWSGATVQRITTTVCGERSLTLRITRRGSVGRVTAVVVTP